MDSTITSAHLFNKRGRTTETTFKEIACRIDQVVVAEICPAQDCGLMDVQGSHQIQATLGCLSKIYLVDDDATGIIPKWLCRL